MRAWTLQRPPNFSARISLRTPSGVADLHSWMLRMPMVFPESASLERHRQDPRLLRCGDCARRTAGSPALLAGSGCSLARSDAVPRRDGVPEVLQPRDARRGDRPALANGEVAED